MQATAEEKLRNEIHRKVADTSRLTDRVRMSTSLMGDPELMGELVDYLGAYGQTYRDLLNRQDAMIQTAVALRSEDVRQHPEHYPPAYYSIEGWHHGPVHYSAMERYIQPQNGENADRHHLLSNPFYMHQQKCMSKKKTQPKAAKKRKGAKADPGSGGEEDDDDEDDMSEGAR